MKRIFTGIAAAAVLMTSIAGTALAETATQNAFFQPQLGIEENQNDQNQMLPPSMPGMQGQGGQNQMTPPAMPGEQGQNDQNQMTPPAMPGEQKPMMTVQTGNSGKLNMRQEPSMSARIVGRYRNGTQVEILEVSDEWVKVSINGKTGYMAIKFLEGEIPEELTSEETGVSADQNADESTST